MALRWSPQVFWSSSLFEFTAACEAFAQANGSDDQAPADSHDLEELMQKYPDK